MSEEFDEHALDYAKKIDSATKFTGKDHAFFTRIKADVLLAKWRAGETAAPAVLDVGCGTAAIHPLLSQDASLLVGVDVSPLSLNVAQANNPDSRFVRYGGNDLPFAPGSFDAVIMICVMHHVPVVRRAALCAELFRVLKAGGELLIIEHNPYNPATRYIVNNCELDRDAVLLSSAACGRLVADAGFKQVTAQFFGVLPFRSALASRIERLIGRLPLGAQYLVSGKRTA